MRPRPGGLTDRVARGRRIRPPRGRHAHIRLPIRRTGWHNTRRRSARSGSSPRPPTERATSDLPAEHTAAPDRHPHTAEAPTGGRQQPATLDAHEGITGTSDHRHRSPALSSRTSGANDAVLTDKAIRLRAAPSRSSGGCPAMSRHRRSHGPPLTTRRRARHPISGYISSRPAGARSAARPPRPDANSADPPAPTNTVTRARGLTRAAAGGTVLPRRAHHASRATYFPAPRRLASRSCTSGTASSP